MQIGRPCGEVLGIEEALRLESAGRTIFSFRHIEDDGVGVKLWRSVAIDRAACLYTRTWRQRFVIWCRELAIDSNRASAMRRPFCERQVDFDTGRATAANLAAL